MLYLGSSIYSQLTSLQGLLLYRKLRALELSSPLDNFSCLSLRLYLPNLLQHTLTARVKIPRITHDELVRVQRRAIFGFAHADDRETKEVAERMSGTRVVLVSCVRGHDRVHIDINTHSIIYVCDHKLVIKIKITLLLSSTVLTVRSGYQYGSIGYIFNKRSRPQVRRTWCSFFTYCTGM